MIKIEQLIPFMKKGWVAMDSNGEWFWFDRKPFVGEVLWNPNEKSDWHGEESLQAFDIAPADDWTKSLIKINQVLGEE